MDEAQETLSRPRVVVIIGSTRFKEFHLGAAQRETLMGNVVLIAGFFHHKDNVPITAPTKAMLDSLGERKIDMADEVFVVNVHGYVGETTATLVRYAVTCGKAVRWLEAPPDDALAAELREIEGMVMKAQIKAGG